MAKLSINAVLGIDTKGARSELGQFQKKGGALSKLGPAFKAIGGAAITAFKVATKAVIDFAVASTKKMMEFQKGMAEVFTLLPGKSKQFKDSFKKDLLEIGTQYGKLTEETVPALYQALSAGVPEKNVMKFLATASELSIGGVMELKEGVGLLTGVTNAFGDSAGTSGEIADVLFTTIKKGTTTGTELAASLGDVLPIAGALGVDFKELNAMIAQSTSITQNTAKSMTGLKGMLAELGKTGMQANKMFKKASGQEFPAFIKAGGSVTEALKMLDKHAKANGVSLMDMFGNLEGGQAALQIATDGFSGINGKMEAFQDVSGASGEATKEMAATFEMSWKKMQARFEKFQIQIGDMLIPILEAISPIIDEIFKMVESLPWDEFAASIKELGNEITTAFSGSGKSAIKDFIKLGFDFVMLLVNMGKAIAKVYKGLADIGVFKVQVTFLKVILGLIGAIIEGWKKMGEALTAIGKGFRGEAHEWGKSIDDVTEKMQKQDAYMKERDRDKLRKEKHEAQRKRDVVEVEAAVGEASSNIGIQKIREFLERQGYKMTPGEIQAAAKSGAFAKMTSNVGTSLAFVGQAVAEIEKKRGITKASEEEKGKAMLAEMGISKAMILAMHKRLGTPDLATFYRVASTKPISELLEMTFGKEQAQRIVALGAKFAEQQAFLKELQAKSLKELAKSLGMTEKEMLENYGAGRIGGPARDIIRRKLAEREKIERKMMGTSKEAIERQKKKEILDAKIRKEEAARAAKAKKEQEAMWKKMNEGAAKASQKEGTGWEEIVKQQSALTKGVKDGTRATEATTRGVDRVREIIKETASPECIALCDDTISKLIRASEFMADWWANKVGKDMWDFAKQTAASAEAIQKMLEGKAGVEKKGTEAFTDTTGMNPSMKYAIEQRDKKLNIYLDAAGKPLTGRALEEAQAKALDRAKTQQALEQMAKQAMKRGSIFTNDESTQGLLKKLIAAMGKRDLDKLIKGSTLTGRRATTEAEFLDAVKKGKLLSTASSRKKGDTWAHLATLFGDARANEILKAMAGGAGKMSTSEAVSKVRKELAEKAAAKMSTSEAVAKVRKELAEKAAAKMSTSEAVAKIRKELAEPITEQGKELVRRAKETAEATKVIAKKLPTIGHVAPANRLASNLQACCKSVHNIDRNITAIEKRLRGCISNQ